MKVIVIAGGGRHVGKTTLAFALADLLPSSKVLKLGEHPPRNEKPSLLMPLNTSYAKILESVPSCPFLILESGSILDDPDLSADLVIFLPTEEGRTDKPGSERRRAKADVVRGKSTTEESISFIKQKLGMDSENTKRIHAAIESTG